MLIVKRHHTNPYFNLAAEEYFLKESGEDIFMLWRNEPSIIVGKHQNTLSEINIDFVKENNISVVRRLTGGGQCHLVKPSVLFDPFGVVTFFAC